MMGPAVPSRVATLALAGALTLLPASRGWSQTPSSSAPQSPAAASSSTSASGGAQESAVSSADLARIRQALKREPSLKLDDTQLRYYVEILAKQPRWSEFVKGYDLKNGPTKGGNPMTHQEFLNMVTPKELYSTAGIRPTEMLQFALVNWVGQALIKKALTDVANAHSEHELQDIRDRIDRELAALKGSVK